MAVHGDEVEGASWWGCDKGAVRKRWEPIGGVLRWGLEIYGETIDEYVVSSVFFFSGEREICSTVTCKVS